MRLMFLASLLVVAVMGCQAAPKQTSAVAAGTPQLVKELTNQTTVYTCPDCKMEFDRPGKCTMCNVDLVETRVEYVCPADNQPVGQAGKCPRCGADARVIKTVVAPKAKGAPGAG